MGRATAGRAWDDCCLITAFAWSVASTPHARAINGHRHAFVNRLDFKFKTRSARALDFDLHPQGLGFSRTMPAVFVKLNADRAGLDGHCRRRTRRCPYRL